MVLVCQVISQDYMIKASHDCLESGWKPLKVSSYPPKFSDHRDFGRGNLVILVYHVTFQDRGILWTRAYHSKL